MQNLFFGNLENCNWEHIFKTKKSSYYNFAKMSLMLVGFAFVYAPQTKAQEHHHKHHNDFYRHWMQPNNPNMSCCNARFNQFGAEVGDCEETDARLIKNSKGEMQWETFVPMINRWELVPESKIIKEKNPDQTGIKAHVCWSKIGEYIICFVPPTGTF